MITGKEVENLYKEGKIKDGDKLDRIWSDEHISPGIFIIDRYNSFAQYILWKALENYNNMDGCFNGNIYGLGDYSYICKKFDRKRKLNKLNNYEK